MKINFEQEVNDVTSRLKTADGYLDCEAVIFANIKKHVAAGIPIPAIESYLEKLKKHFEDKMVAGKGDADAVNNKYAACYLKTIVSAPYWHSWIKTNK